MEGMFLMPRYEGSDDEFDKPFKTDKVKSRKKHEVIVIQTSNEAQLENSFKKRKKMKSEESEDNPDSPLKPDKVKSKQKYEVSGIETNNEEQKENSSKKRKRIKIEGSDYDPNGPLKINGIETENKHEVPHFKKTETDNEVQSASSSKKRKKMKSCQTILDSDKGSQILNCENQTSNAESADSQSASQINENFCIIGQKKSQAVENIKPDLPRWLRDPTFINDSHEDLPVCELKYIDDETKKILSDCGIATLFPVQQALIPWMMNANYMRMRKRPSDVCVSAPTGSGKTLSFVIPIVQLLRERISIAVRALVVLPVSDLALQVYKVFKTFTQGTDLKVIFLCGKNSFSTEQKRLVKKGYSAYREYRWESNVDIIVTTPGRIIDHINQTEGFNLEYLRYLVIDEADRMLEDIQKGWLKQIEDAFYKNQRIPGCICGPDVSLIEQVRCVCANVEKIEDPLQKLLFSATLSRDPEKLHTLKLHRPKLFITQYSDESNDWIGKCPLPESLSSHYIVCDAEVKPLVLCDYIKKNGFKKVLCFTESLDRAQRLNLVLNEMGVLISREMSSNFTPIQRKITLKQFSVGKINVLICSDLVARGIDIKDIDCVVSYDVPQLIKTYVHRIGRTARAGKMGTAATLLTKGQFPHFKKMLTSAELALPLSVQVDTEAIGEYIDTFKKALKIVNEKLRKLKHKEKRKLNSVHTSNKK